MRISSRVRGCFASRRAATRLTSRSRRSTSERGDELFDPFVASLERVLAEHRPLGLVVQFEMNPVDSEVPAAFLRPADELAPEAGPRGLRRLVDRRVDCVVGADPVDETFGLHAVE